MKAIQIEVNLSVWAGRKLDKTASRETGAVYQAQAGSISVHKLLINKEFLAPLQKIANEARNYVYKSTLPWSGSLRLLPIGKYHEFNAVLLALQSDFEQGVSELSNNYNAAIRMAKTELGLLFDGGQYPPLSVLKKKFKFHILYSPVNATTETVYGDMLGIEFEKAKSKNLERALEALQNEYMEQLEHVKGMLEDEDKILHKSLLTNALSLAEKLESFEILNPQLKQIAEELKGVFSVDIQKIKKDKGQRQRTQVGISKLLANAESWV